MYEDYLTHHGIKGQKWGIRRYQNSGGTWTALGKQHRREETVESSKRKIKTDKIFEPIIKNGKDKEKISPAESAATETKKIVDNVNTIYKNAKKVKESEEPRESKTLSDEELKRRIARLRLEKEYEQLKKEDTEKGKAKTEEILASIGAVAAIGVSVAKIYTLLKRGGIVS